MEHIAIDLASRESQICVRSPEGTILEERRLKTDALDHFLKQRPASRVVIETSAETFAVADVAKSLGHEVRVVPATLVRSLGVGARGVKTDRRDAQVLSEVSARINLPSVHLPSAASRDKRAICTSREALVQARTQLINSVRGWLRTQRRRVSGMSSKTFGTRLKQSDLPWPSHIQSMLTVIETLAAQIRSLDNEVAELAKNDAVCARLMTVPGVGPVTALRFVAAIDDCSRFQSASAVQAYFGLVPGERSSGEKKCRTSLTKAGNSKVRWTLVQAAWSAWRYRGGDPMVTWAKRIAERRGKHVAVVALARKLAGILYAIWRDDTRYDPIRTAQRIDADGVVHNASEAS